MFVENQLFFSFPPSLSERLNIVTNFTSTIIRTTKCLIEPSVALSCFWLCLVSLTSAWSYFDLILTSLLAAMVIREEGVESLVAKLVRLAEEKRRVIEWWATWPAISSGWSLSALRPYSALNFSYWTLRRLFDRYVAVSHAHNLARIELWSYSHFLDITGHPAHQIPFQLALTRVSARCNLTSVAHIWMFCVRYTTNIYISRPAR